MEGFSSCWVLDEVGRHQRQLSAIATTFIDTPLSSLHVSLLEKLIAIPKPISSSTTHASTTSSARENRVHCGKLQLETILGYGGIVHPRTLAPRRTTLQSTNAANLVVSATYPITLSPAFISFIHRRPASVAALLLGIDVLLAVLILAGEEAPSPAAPRCSTSAGAATAGDTKSPPVDMAVAVVVLLLHLPLLHDCCGANTVGPAAKKAWHGEAPYSAKVANVAAAAAAQTLRLVPAVMISSSLNLWCSSPSTPTHSRRMGVN